MPAQPRTVYLMLPLLCVDDRPASVLVAQAVGVDASLVESLPLVRSESGDRVETYTIASKKYSVEYLNFCIRENEKYQEQLLRCEEALFAYNSEVEILRKDLSRVPTVSPAPPPVSLPSASSSSSLVSLSSSGSTTQTADVNSTITELKMKNDRLKGEIERLREELRRSEELKLETQDDLETLRHDFAILTKDILEMYETGAKANPTDSPPLRPSVQRTLERMYKAIPDDGGGGSGGSFSSRVPITSTDDDEA